MMSLLVVMQRAAALVVAAVLMAAPAYAQRAVQVAPDGKLMVNKLFAAQQWSIVVDFDTQTIGGNVFNTDGSEPQFVWCEIVEPPIDGPSDFVGLDAVTLDCQGADGCAAWPCARTAWTELGTLDVIGSFFLPPQAPTPNLTATPLRTVTPLRTSTLHATTTPHVTVTPHPQPTFTSSGDLCCKHCSTGKPCGDSCISFSFTCHQPPGCACV